MDERRKTIRVDCRGEYFWRTTLSTPVRVLDIGEGGVLLASCAVLPFSEGGRLRIRFAGLPFEAGVRVVRRTKTARVGEPMPCQMATMFDSLDERSRHVMRQFIRTATGDQRRF